MSVTQTVLLAWHVWRAGVKIPVTVEKMPSALLSSTGQFVPATQVMREIHKLLVHRVRTPNIYLQLFTFAIILLSSSMNNYFTA